MRFLDVLFFALLIFGSGCGGNGHSSDKKVQDDGSDNILKLITNKTLDISDKKNPIYENYLTVGADQTAVLLTVNKHDGLYAERKVKLYNTGISSDLYDQKPDLFNSPVAGFELELLESSCNLKQEKAASGQYSHSGKIIDVYKSMDFAIKNKLLVYYSENWGTNSNKPTFDERSVTTLSTDQLSSLAHILVNFKKGCE